VNLTIPILPELQTITDATKTDHLVFPATQTMKPFTSNDFGKAALLGDLISILLTPYDDSAAFSGRKETACGTKRGSCRFDL
jgi:hypothetical protein